MERGCNPAGRCGGGQVGREPTDLRLAQPPLRRGTRLLQPPATFLRASRPKAAAAEADEDVAAGVKLPRAEPGPARPFRVAQGVLGIAEPQPAEVEILLGGHGRAEALGGCVGSAAVEA